MSAFLYQIFYHEDHLKHLYPFAIPYHNRGLTIFFENELIRALIESNLTCDKIAVCSWKLKDKMKWFIGRPRELTQDVLNSDYEVLAMTKNTKYHHMLAAANQWHPGFLIIFDKILAKIGVTRPGEVKIALYQNHFSARTEIYKDYVKTYLAPAMDCITNDKEINVLAMQNSKYSDLTNTSAEHLKTKLGISFYPLVPFLLERLFSIYVHNHRINVIYL